MQRGSWSLQFQSDSCCLTAIIEAIWTAHAEWLWSRRLNAYWTWPKWSGESVSDSDFGIFGCFQTRTRDRDNLWGCRKLPSSLQTQCFVFVKSSFWNHFKNEIHDVCETFTFNLIQACKAWVQNWTLVHDYSRTALPKKRLPGNCLKTVDIQELFAGGWSTVEQRVWLVFGSN